MLWLFFFFLRQALLHGHAKSINGTGSVLRAHNCSGMHSKLHWGGNNMETCAVHFVRGHKRCIFLMKTGARFIPQNIQSCCSCESKQPQCTLSLNYLPELIWIGLAVALLTYQWTFTVAPGLIIQSIAPLPWPEICHWLSFEILWCIAGEIIFRTIW